MQVKANENELDNMLTIKEVAGESFICCYRDTLLTLHPNQQLPK